MSEPRTSDPAKPIAPGDIAAKLAEIDKELNETKEAAKPVGMAVGAGAVVLILLLAFLLGRRKGNLASTVVEVRRI